MNIKLKVELPKVKWDAKLSGVYKLQFDNGMFYIGSSVKLHGRAGQWRSYLGGEAKCSLKDMKKMRGKIEKCKEATFWVIEFVDEGLRELEYRYIKKNVDNPLMLNTFSFEKKPIIEYNMKGKEVARYTSASQASKIKYIQLSRIKEVLTGGRKSHLGSIYKYQNSEDNCVRVRNRGVRSKLIAKKIKVLRFTKDGEPAGEFFTTIEAARVTGVDKKGVYSVLVGKGKTAGGYVFKYADLE